MRHTIPASSGVSFMLKKNQILTVVDIEGHQVADLFCVSAVDHKEVLSCAKSLDYNDGLFLSEGDLLYSIRSEVMLEIVKDTCGRNDLLMPPCSLKMFQLVSGDENLYHPSCHENLTNSLKSFGLTGDDIQNSFNIFMNVKISENGFLKIEEPTSQKGDVVSLLAHMDLMVGLTACSHEDTNGGRLKPIGYEIHSGGNL